MDIQYGQYVVPTSDVMVNFGVGQPSNSELPLELVKKSCTKICEIDDNALLQYGDIPGYKQFRVDFAKFLERNYEKDVDYNNLFITNGVTGAISLISSLFIKKCKRVYVEEPTYFLVINIFKEFGFEVVSVNINDDGIDLDDLKEKMSDDTNETKLLYTIPTFHNPTSITMSDEKRKDLISLSQDTNMYIIADEVYQLLYFDEKPPLPLYYYGGNVFSLSSFSKILAPSLRLGWIQCNDDLMKMLSSCGQLDSSGGINPFISRIVHNIINCGDLDEYAAKTRSILKQRCNTLADSLTGINFNRPTGGYFIWCKLPFDSPKFLDYCSDKKVKFHVGSKFSGNGNLGEYIRLSFSFYDLEGLQIGGNRLSELYTKYIDTELKETISIYGATGKLGSKICENANSHGYNVLPLKRDLSNIMDRDGVIVDVTSPEGTKKLISVLIHVGINRPLIIGTTGDFSEDCKQLINEYSKKNVVFKVSNFSYGVPSILKLVKNMDKSTWDITVRETHHIHKKDKPSGTAKSIADALNVCYSEVDSIREGEVFGKHDIILSSQDEKITISHEAKNRDIFAKGFFRFVELIKDKSNGYYESNFENNYTRYSVCGNTFVVTDKYQTNITQICDKFNVDGLIWYSTEVSEYDFMWMYWNRDGSLVEMCVNGSRCIAYHFMKESNKTNIRFINNFNIEQYGKYEDEDELIAVSCPEYTDYSVIDEDTYFVRVGVPHVVRYIKNYQGYFEFSNFNLKSLYEELNNELNKKLGTRFNVSIVLDGNNKYIRTYEKGVENETGACGSACIAAIYGLKGKQIIIPRDGIIEIENNYIKSKVDLF